MRRIFFILPALLSTIPAFARADELSLTEQLRQAGFAIIPIIGLSVMAMAVIFERALRCRRDSVVPDDLVERLSEAWRQGEFDKVADLAAHSDSTLGRMIEHVVQHRHLGPDALSDAVGDIASLELRTHQQKIYPLTIAATVAPIIGLLGTVLGMIDAFHVIAFSGAMGDPALLAGGISKALVNTASGLTVALPSLLAYHFFKNRIAHFGLELEKRGGALLREWFPLRKAAPVALELETASHAH